jgi:signal peptidase
LNKRVSFSEFLPLIKENLDNNGETIITITGTSMLPLLRHRRDRVLLVAPKKRLKKLDIPLYRRDNGVFVLHRVVGVKDGNYILCGDHQHEKEYPVRHDQIIGVVKGFWRDEKYIKTDSPVYLLYSRVWTALLPVRKYVFRALSLFKAARRKLIEGFRGSKMDL